MALPVNLYDLIHQRVVENTRIEYKANWNPESILHSITAFANDFDNLGGGSSNTVKANYLEERELIGLARNIPFDDRINYHAEIADMRSSLISEFLHTVESELYEGSLDRTVEEVAMDMRLVGGPTG